MLTTKCLWPIQPVDIGIWTMTMAASQTARRVQAVYDGTSLLVRRRTILPGGPDHAGAPEAV